MRSPHTLQHIVAGLLHLTTAAITSGARSGSHLISWFSAWVVLPYTCVALAQRYAARTALYQRHRTLCALLFEAVFIALCADGLPNWVLVEPTDIRVSGQLHWQGHRCITLHCVCWHTSHHACCLLTSKDKVGVAGTQSAH